MLASQQVIDAIVARLVAAGTGSASRVYSDRFHPLAAFPTTKVLHVDEDLQADEDDITWPPTQLHKLEIDVQTVVQAATALDDAMSTAAQQVLQALSGVASPLAPMPVALQPTGIRYQAQQDGAASTGLATVRFSAQFQTRANDPTTIL